MANVVVSALATWNGKALKKAKQDVDVFNKQLKTLARTFGVAFSATAIVSFSKKAIKAFTEDEAAAKRLALQLENTGNAFRVDEVEGYIKSLEKTNAILTDLRAPFQTLLNLTGSVELAQRSLESALNISAGTGESLSTVVSAISSGIRGQTKAIKNLNTGIDANIIASGDMNKIMEALDKRFSGQAAARLDTYAGKMDVLKKGADEATKAIGTGLVDAITLLSEDRSIQDAADQMENFGIAIANAIVGMTELLKKADRLLTVNDEGKFFEILLALQPGGKAGAKLLSELNKFFAASRVYEPSGNTANARENRLNQLFREAVKYRKAEIDQLKKKTEVDKLSEKFDVERIGLMKALGEATDAETKLRLQSKLAILDNNEALSKKYLAELNAKTAADLLAQAGKNAAESLNTLPGRFDQIFKNVYEQVIAMGNDVASARSLAGQSARMTAEAEAFANNTGRYAQDLNPIYGPSTTPTSQGNTYIDMTLNTGAVLSSNQDLERYIQDALGNITKLGNGALVPAGSIAFA
jgi:hypothetical protein